MSGCGGPGGGISGEIIRDMTIECVDKRFGTFRTPNRGLFCCVGVGTQQVPDLWCRGPDLPMPVLRDQLNYLRPAALASRSN